MNILYFASLREKLNTEQEQWDNLHTIHTAADLLKTLQARGEPWSSALRNPQLLISVNQELVTPDFPIKQGDELAFFPPVTGG